MARGKQPEPAGGEGGSRLAGRRVAAGLSQKALADLTGISLSTIQRIERGEIANPKIKTLANCAIVLGCQIDDVIEPAWREWWNAGGPKPPTDPQIAAAREQSFKPSPGRPPDPYRKDPAPTPTERARRDRISKSMKRHWAKKRAEPNDA